MRNLTAATLLFATLLAGCATQGPGSHAGQSYVINSQRTLFYRYGPAQASGPDFALSHGERVTMLSYEFGYSQVTIPETGMSGWVPTDELSPAPPLPKASPSLIASRSRRHHADDAMVTGGDIHVPLPEFPESKPPPGSPPFRY